MAPIPKNDHQTPKHIIALTFLIQRPLNTLEALNLYGDTCLNTTISHLTHQHGFRFIKKLEPHRNQAGGLVYFKRYWLEDDHIAHASHLIQRHLPNFMLGACG